MNAIETAILTAYAAIADRDHQPVMLADIRPHLDTYNRADVDRALVELFASGTINLTPCDSGRGLTGAHWAAAVRCGGQERHQMSAVRVAAAPATPAPAAPAAAPGLTADDLAAQVRVAEPGVARALLGAMPTRVINEVAGRLGIAVTGTKSARVDTIVFFAIQFGRDRAAIYRAA